jgi:hypothetical protein
MLFLLNWSAWLSFLVVAAPFRQVIDGTLTDISALLGGNYDIRELRVFRAFAARRFECALSRNAEKLMVYAIHP